MKALKLIPTRLPVFVVNKKKGFSKLPQDVDAFLITPEIAIHVSPDSKGWSVVHVPTLYALFTHINTKENAATLADMFSKLNGIESMTPLNISAYIYKHPEKFKAMINFERANQWK